MNHSNATYYKYEFDGQNRGVFAVDLPYPEDEKNVDDYTDLLTEIGRDISNREHCIVLVGGRRIVPDFDDFLEDDVIQYNNEKLPVYLSYEEARKHWPLALMETFEVKRIAEH
ncbi:hypothetical protein [Azomonas macrocytogenes]|uniref:Uncharacterized protein n=1 Tax=Azomonas macrocytogenes TaxID=69962 RepID=A0A839T7E0_AZOMA|nr:hypothetical protein [Azomonas macrocytogenes]MBB3104174.1 hypothetical protein [Azomonas macrocytogenes]